MTLAPSRRIRQVVVPLAVVPAPETVPPATCRRSRCGEPAADEHGLCEAHGAAQDELRSTVVLGPVRLGQRTKAANEVAEMLAGIIRARAEPWRQTAACRGRSDVMLPPSKQGNTAEVYRPALAVCETCPVVEPCREAGAREIAGVWGGTMPAQRHKRQRQGARPFLPR